MPHPRTLIALPLAAAAALLVGAQPAAAAPAVTTSAATMVKPAPSPLHDLYLEGICPSTPLKGVVAMQWLNWMWAPLALDNADGSPLPQVLVPSSMLITGEGWRARHDLVPGVVYTAPWPQPAQPTTCVFQGWTADGAFELTVAGTLVTIPKRLDAMLPPIKPPAKA